MAFKVSIKLPSGLSGADKRVQRGLHSGVQKATAMFTNAAISNAPRRTGTLKRSIHAEVDPIGARLTGKVVQDSGVAHYGIFQEMGTGIYGPKNTPITPKNGKFLVFQVGKKKVFARSVKGVKPKRFMRDAFLNNKEEARKIIQDEVNKAIKGGS